MYDQDATQEEVYQQSAKQVVLSTLQGYNAAIIAYGQTGTGGWRRRRAVAGPCSQPRQRECRSCMLV